MNETTTDHEDAMPAFRTMAELKRANKAAGMFWFSPDTMRFFGTQIHGELYPGGYFITSEKPPYAPRAFTIRKANADASIETVGELCGHATLNLARATLKDLALDLSREF